MTATVSASDLELRDAIIQELDWDSSFDAAAIGVTARGGAVTLTGSIDSYAGKLAAERAAKRVAGVRAVANDIQVTLRHERGDAEIVGDVAHSLALRPTLPEGVQAVVRSGHATLTGSVRTLFQRAIAERAVHEIRGVKGVTNRIVVASGASGSDLQRRITDALRRDSDIASEGITVIVADGTVALRGRVPSWRQREAAERAAMHAPGVIGIENQLVVSP